MLWQNAAGRNEKDLAKLRHTRLGTQSYTADFWQDELVGLLPIL